MQLRPECPVREVVIQNGIETPQEAQAILRMRRPLTCTALKYSHFMPQGPHICPPPALQVYTHWNWRSRSIEYVQSPLYAAAGGFWHIRHWQILEHVLQVLLLGITAKLLFPHRWSAGVHLLFWVPQVLFKVWTLLALFGVDYVYLTWDGWVVGFGVFVIFYAQLLIINCVIPCEQRPFRTKKQMVIFIGMPCARPVHALCTPCACPGARPGWLVGV